MKENIYRIIIIGLLALFVGFSYWVKKNIRANQRLVYNVSDQIKPFTLPTIDRRPVELQDIVSDNKLTWVNFWATWCGPCRQEMPMMSELYEQYHEKGLGMVGISIGERPATVTKYLTKSPVPYPILVDSMRTQSQPSNITTVPTSFLVDDSGMILHVSEGIPEGWDQIIKRTLDDE
ncbi:TlpA family protein disulfide reductase [Fodinibius salsisoli]|uniref:TlpA family protein disulfide reductase n=1 Tax=Fodinibius salsisoli TaxID=2820877 RepID=A0ABT3PT12_9BACT|nr:TlpA disulfide reductase family protein [Fodinibius salsisoli]MCW9708993.1 TlpA family protein disulfide reductase [Fodinibius salsisoli]